MQETRHRASAKQRREEAEDPRQINPEARQQGEEEEDADHPVKKARVHRMTQQFTRIDNGAPETVDGIGAMYEAIGRRGRHLVLLSRGRLRRVNSHDRRSGLCAPWTFEDVMHHHPYEAQHGAKQSNRLEDVLPNRETERNARLRRQIAVAFRLGDVVQHVDDVRAADRVRVVDTGILES